MFFSAQARVATLAVLLAFSAHTAPGQVATVPVGARVRLTTEKLGTPIVGVLTERTTDSLRIELKGGSVKQHAVALSELRSLDRSVNTSGHGLIGGILGLGAGLLIGSVISSSDNPETCHVSANDPLCVGQIAGEIVGSLGVMVGSGLLGTILGAIVGSSIRTDAWRPVILAAQRGLGFHVAPVVSGRRLGVSIAF